MASRQATSRLRGSIRERLVEPLGGLPAGEETARASRANWLPGCDDWAGRDGLHAEQAIGAERVLAGTERGIADEAAMPQLRRAEGDVAVAIGGGADRRIVGHEAFLIDSQQVGINVGEAWTLPIACRCGAQKSQKRQSVERGIKRVVGRQAVVHQLIDEPLSQAKCARGRERCRPARGACQAAFRSQ